MKKKQVQIRVTDHAVLRWLERAHDVDIDLLRDYLSDVVENGASLGATAVQVDRVKFVLTQLPNGAPEPAHVVVVTTKRRK